MKPLSKLRTKVERKTRAKITPPALQPKDCGLAKTRTPIGIHPEENKDCHPSPQDWLRIYDKDSTSSITKRKRARKSCVRVGSHRATNPKGHLPFLLFSTFAGSGGHQLETDERLLGLIRPTHRLSYSILNR